MNTEKYIIKCESENAYELVKLYESFDKMTGCTVYNSTSKVCGEGLDNGYRMKINVTLASNSNAEKWEKEWINVLRKNKLVRSIRKELYAFDSNKKDANNDLRKVLRKRSKKWTVIDQMNRLPINPIEAIDKLVAKRRCRPNRGGESLLPTANLSTKKRVKKLSIKTEPETLTSDRPIPIVIGDDDDDDGDLVDTPGFKDLQCDGQCMDIQCPAFKNSTNSHEVNVEDGCLYSQERAYFQNLTPADLASV